MDINNYIPSLLSSFGFFGPVAWLGWWIINTQRKDLQAERDRYKEALLEEKKRSDALVNRVFALAETNDKTIKELTVAISDATHH